MSPSFTKNFAHDIIQSLPIYIISMDKDRYERTMEEVVTKGGFPLKNVIHFHAVDGSSLSSTSDDDITPFAQHFCTPKMIGNGLSHIHVARTFLQHTDSPDMALILEDDVRTFPDTLTRLEELFREMMMSYETLSSSPTRKWTAEWDIFLLFYQGLCRMGHSSEKDTKIQVYGCGSTAAYLLSRQGAIKMSQIRVFYHTDLQRNSSLFHVRCPTEPIFLTYDSSSKDTSSFLYQTTHQTMDYWLHQPVCNLPFSKILPIMYDIHCNVRTYLLLCILILCALCACFVFYKQTRILTLNLITIFLSFHIVFLFYVHREVFYYQSTLTTHYYALLFSAFLISIQSKVAMNNVLLKFVYLMGSYVFFFFHLLHHTASPPS